MNAWQPYPNNIIIIFIRKNTEAQSKEPMSLTVGGLRFYTIFQFVNAPVRRAIICFCWKIYL